MLCSSLNEDDLLTYHYPEFCLTFCFANNFFLVVINFPKQILVNLINKESCHKDNFQPSRDAALLYSTLHGPHGHHGLIFTTYSVVC